MSLLAAIAWIRTARCRVLGVVEGQKEDKAGWLGFLKQLRKRGLNGVRLIISDACLGLAEAAAEFILEAAWQRCTVHFYRNVFSHVSRGKVREVAAMLKSNHSQESRAAPLDRAKEVVAKLQGMKLGADAGDGSAAARFGHLRGHA